MKNKIKDEFKATWTPNAKGGVDVELTCTKCGKQLTRSDEYGVFCDNNCGRKESIAAYKALKILVPFINW